MCWRFLLLVALVLSASWLNAKDMVYLVEVEHAKSMPHFSVERDYIATVKADKFSQISPKEAGVVEEILVKADQRVKKGQLLLTLKNDLDQRSLKLALSQVELLRNELKRNRDLLKSHDITKAQVERTERELLAAEAQAEQYKKEIRAPFDGVVGVPRVALGETVQAGAALISIMDGNFYVFINVPGSRLAEIKLGQTVKVKDIITTVSAIERSIDPITRMGFLRAELPACSSCIVGDSLKAHIVVHDKVDAILVDKNAIYYQNAKPHMVLVIKRADGALEALVREVVVGQEQGEQLEILSGLSVGEQFVKANPKRIPKQALLRVVE